MRFLLACLLYFLAFQPLCLSQEFDNRLLISEEEMKEDAILATEEFFNSINKVVDMGRRNVPKSDANEEIERLLYLFHSDATIEESFCKNRVEAGRRTRPVKDYLNNQYRKAKKRYFKIEFDPPSVHFVEKNLYEVRTNFLQRFESATYEDSTLKGVQIKFFPRGNNRFTLKIMKVVVLHTNCP